MVFKIISIFPEMLESILSVSIIGRAVKNGLININYVNLRDYTEDKHKKVDDYPFGGGPGMLLNRNRCIVQLWIIKLKEPEWSICLRRVKP